MGPSLDVVSSAAANVFDAVLRGGLADLRPLPAKIVSEAPQRTVYRYLTASEQNKQRPPVLLVPPLAAPVRCFDLRRGCSLAEHLVGIGRQTYLLEYGDIAFSDRQLGLEHWVEDILPAAIDAVYHDAGQQPVQIIGWCLGGIMTLLAVAAKHSLPVGAITVVASPFDFDSVRIIAPIRPVAEITNGLLGTIVYRALGGAPAGLVRRVYQISSIDKYLTKPLILLANLHDRDVLAQIEAVDRFTAEMHAYPGRTMGQLYHRFFRINDLADGNFELNQRTIHLSNIKVPVLAIAGKADVLAPPPAVHALEPLLSGSSLVRVQDAPGGHLGVLTGRGAKTTTWPAIDDFFQAAEAL